MSNNLKEQLWLVGGGYMAVEYAKVLDGLGRKFTAVGRGKASCTRFFQESGHNIAPGGVEGFLENHSAPQEAIVTVNIEELCSTAAALLSAGVKRILLEKPAGMNRGEIQRLADLAKEKNAEVYVAYNRRFYAATRAAKEHIARDGGVRSFNFEFTEWSHQIVTLNKTATELGAWFLANSTHVIDLAFFLGGEPREMNSFVRGSLSWYKPASIFAGSGVSDQDALFSYQANWQAPGRWGVELLTDKHRYIFRPMEKLQMQDIGSVKVYDAPEVDCSLDTTYKPGLYLQTKAFLEGEEAQMLALNAHLKNLDYYDVMEMGGRL